MKIAIPIMFIIILGFVLCIAYLIDAGEKKYREFVGEKVVLMNDTLVITDFSTMSKRLFLNNGASIDMKSISEYIIKKDTTK